MDDLISRAEAIRIAEQGQVQGFEWQFKKLCDLPSVRPRKGKWIYEGIRGRFPACSCSVCGSKENADWAIMQGANFCPNCGADMRGDSE